jgi:hypothetical protein
MRRHRNTRPRSAHPGGDVGVPAGTPLHWMRRCRWHRVSGGAASGLRPDALPPANMRGVSGADGRTVTAKAWLRSGIGHTPEASRTSAGGKASGRRSDASPPDMRGRLFRASRGDAGSIPGTHLHESMIPWVTPRFRWRRGPGGAASGLTLLPPAMCVAPPVPMGTVPDHHPSGRALCA